MRVDSHSLSETFVYSGTKFLILIMVRISYNDIETAYTEVKKFACGRKACSVMILVGSEVDAMSSARMLTHQLRTDNIAYTLRPVSNFAQILLYRESCVTEQISSIFLINCGAVRTCNIDSPHSSANPYQFVDAFLSPTLTPIPLTLSVYLMCSLS